MVTLIVGERVDDGSKEYINLEHYPRISVQADRVSFWTPDNLQLDLKKTAELKKQLDLLLVKAEDSKGFEKFK